MIKSFLHKGVENFFKTGKTSGIQVKHTAKIRLILTNLNVAEKLGDMDLPGLDLHRLKRQAEDCLGGESQSQLAHHVSLPRA